MQKKLIKSKLDRLIKDYITLQKKEDAFIAGKTKVRYSGAYYDAEEIISMTHTLLDGWFGLGLKGEKLEKALSSYIGSSSALLTNSGSSASLLSMAALASDLFQEKVLPGSEVITPACTFATTAAAIVHQNLVPVFLDNDIDTLNINPDHIEAAITDKTRIIFLPHTLGNPNEMDKIMKIAKNYKLLLVEDNCDALGSEYNGKKTGSFGILATCSFYPAHHITMAGEGGAVLINDQRLYRTILAFRNWGRGCWCTSLETDRNGACKNRFNFKIDSIPIDHKYYFMTLGYNLKPVEVQAAMGLIQLRKFPQMAQSRRDNFAKLFKFFQNYEDVFILPRSPKKADPCWFSFPLTIKDTAKFTRRQITEYLEDHLIETRTVFAGNIVRQPAFKRVNYRVVGGLKNADKVLKDTFFIGLGPHITKHKLSYMQEVFSKFLKNNN